MIFTPTLPNLLGEILAVPTMRLKKITGTTIIFSSRTKRSPKGCTHKIYGPANNPIIAPRTRPMRMRIRRFDLKYQSINPFFSSSPFTAHTPSFYSWSLCLLSQSNTYIKHTSSYVNTAEQGLQCACTSCNNEHPCEHPCLKSCFCCFRYFKNYTPYR